jgi:hypothetical protein
MANTKTMYTGTLGKRICAEIASGRSMSEVCRLKWAPGYTTLKEWVKRYPAFAADIDQARLDGCDAIADQLLTISDEVVSDSAEASRQRVRIEARRWLISKLHPRYADKVSMDLNVKGDARQAEVLADQVILADKRLDRLQRREVLKDVAAGLPDGPVRQLFLSQYPEAAPYCAPIESTATRILTESQK